MSYRLYVSKRNPIALWMMDDTAPFQDHAGMDLAAAVKSGSTEHDKSSALVSGASASSVVDNTHQVEFDSPVFRQGQEQKTFALEAWVYPIIPSSGVVSPQKVLSHDSVYDGITIEGNTITFATEYLTTGRAECSYTMPFPQAAHIVGIHTFDENSLYVNDELVASVLVTPEQKSDTYVSTDGKLYAGETTSAQKLAINGVAVYSSMDPNTVTQNFSAGRASVPSQSVPPQFDGSLIDIDRRFSSIYLDQEWSNREAFSTGYVQDVSISDDRVLPYYSNDLSVPGSIAFSVPLDDDGTLSIYGVAVQWEGRDISLEASIDDTNWSPLENGRMASVVPTGTDPTDLDFQVRVSFAGGLAEDPAYLKNLRVVSIRDSSLNISETRNGTLVYPAAPLDDFEPIEYRDNNGVALSTGSLTINPDSDPDVEFQVIELWVKTETEEPVVTPAAATVYRNGQGPGGEVGIPVGEWMLMHYVLAAPSSSAITISGDCVVGQVATYTSTLTASEIEYIYQSYLGRPVIRIEDSSDVVVSEPATPYALYAHDWSIDGAGG